MKFKVTVTRTDEYIIELDENIYNEAWLADFSKVFYDFNIREVAEHLAQFQARFGSVHDFIEGFGYVTRNGKLPFGNADFDANGNWLPEDQRRQPAPGLNIVILSEDEDLEIETELIPAEEAQTTQP